MSHSLNEEIDNVERFIHKNSISLIPSKMKLEQSSKKIINGPLSVVKTLKLNSYMNKPYRKTYKYKNMRTKRINKLRTRGKKYNKYSQRHLRKYKHGRRNKRTNKYKKRYHYGGFSNGINMTPSSVQHSLPNNNMPSIPNYPTGYSQYANNTPNTPYYGLGSNQGISALANPIPIQQNSCPNGNCIDNYNHNIGAGFQSRI